MNLRGARAGDLAEYYPEQAQEAKQKPDFGPGLERRPPFPGPPQMGRQQRLELVGRARGRRPGVRPGAPARASWRLLASRPRSADDGHERNHTPSA